MQRMASKEGEADELNTKGRERERRVQSGRREEM